MYAILLNCEVEEYSAYGRNVPPAKFPSIALESSAASMSLSAPVVWRRCTFSFTDLLCFFFSPLFPRTDFTLRVCTIKYILLVCDGELPGYSCVKRAIKIESNIIYASVFYDMLPGIFGMVATAVTDTVFSWVRMLIALGISILIGVFVGIYAGRSQKAERVIMPIVDIFQTIPILAFFPFVIYLFVGFLPPFVGINAAVVFLIITGMLWNIIFGVYEAVKTLPKEFDELSGLYDIGVWQRIKKIYIPASMPNMVQQAMLSWSIGLFYLVTSEIFSVGNKGYAVAHGIGAALACPALSGPNAGYLPTLIDIAVFVLFVIATRFLFFKPMEDYASRYERQGARQQKRAGIVSALAYAPLRTFMRIPNRIGRVEAVKKIAKGRKVLLKSREVGKSSISAYKKALVVASIAVALILVAVATNMLKYEWEVVYNLAFSLARVWVAFAASVAIAIPISVYMIFVTRQGSKYKLLFQIIASIPATILLPLIATALNGVEYQGEIVAFIIFLLSGVWYLIFSIMRVSGAIPPNIHEVRKIYGVKGKSAWRKIYLMAIIPGLLTGSITAVAAEWNASIVAEYFTSCGISGGVVSGSSTTLLTSVKNGLGVMLDKSLAQGNLQLMVIALANMVIMILLINTFVWRRLYKKASEVYN